MINEIGGDLRKWSGISASIGLMTPVGIDPSVFVLEVRDLNLLYNTASTVDNSKLNWDDLTSDGLFTVGSDDVISLAGLVSTLDLSIKGGLGISIGSVVSGFTNISRVVSSFIGYFFIGSSFGIGSVILFLGSAIVIPLIIAYLPSDYFTRAVKPFVESRETEMTEAVFTVPSRST